MAEYLSIKDMPRGPEMPLQGAVFAGDELLEAGVSHWANAIWLRQAK